MVNHAEVERLIKKGMDYAFRDDVCVYYKENFCDGIEELYSLDWEDFVVAYKEKCRKERDDSFFDEEDIIHEKWWHYERIHKDPHKYHDWLVVGYAFADYRAWNSGDPEIVAGLALALWKDEPILFGIVDFCSFAYKECGKRIGDRVYYKKNVAKKVYKILDGLSDEVNVYSIVSEFEEYGVCVQLLKLCVTNFKKREAIVKTCIDDALRSGDISATVYGVDKDGNKVELDPLVLRANCAGPIFSDVIKEEELRDICACCPDTMVSVGYWLSKAYEEAVFFRYKDDYKRWVENAISVFCNYAIECVDRNTPAFDGKMVVSYENVLRIADYFDLIFAGHKDSVVCELTRGLVMKDLKKFRGFGNVEFVSMEINRDLDTLISLVGDKFNKSDVDSSCREFTDISYETLVKIVESKFANPTEQCNERPVIQHFLRFAKEKPDDYYFSGRVINRKDDFGVYIDAISCKNKKIFRDWDEYGRFYDFIDFFKPDAYYLHPKKADSHGYMGYAWWD